MPAVKIKKNVAAIVFFSLYPKKKGSAWTQYCIFFLYYKQKKSTCCCIFFLSWPKIEAVLSPLWRTLQTSGYWPTFLNWLTNVGHRSPALSDCAKWSVTVSPRRRPRRPGLMSPLRDLHRLTLVIDRQVWSGPATRWSSSPRTGTCSASTSSWAALEALSSTGSGGS